ncbi:uncharacterized protein [Pocillopora verrucosa]|uniref:uncharacterized protein isoform X2 n=1 Tax=Pocillopora verrucosa TaxID=203993 RepID=UPI003342A91A
MNNKRRKGEENERSEDNLRKKRRKEDKEHAKWKQKFKIYCKEFRTDANRDRQTNNSETVDLNMDTSEGEIRNSLFSKLPQLWSRNFRFFTTDIVGKKYYCPCKPKCEDNHREAEWNGRNIAKVVKKDRPVHIFIEGVNESDGSSSGSGTTGTTDNHRPSDPLEDEVRSAGSLVSFLNDEVSSEPPLEIKEIVPSEGNVKGGYPFFLELKDRCVDGFKIQFGETDPIDVEKVNETTYKGTVPASLKVGEVYVKILKTLANVKNTKKVFTYTDKDLEKKLAIEEQVKSMDTAQLQNLMSGIRERFGRMSVKPNEKKRYGDSGGGKNHSLPLNHTIADTAARINAITCFEIMLRTYARRTLFKSLEDSQPPLKEIAKLTGHTEIAILLEEKHLMFRDDENDSNTEVDWEAISKVIGEYQARRDESVEKCSLQSTDSSQSVHGYLADRENSSSLSSLKVSSGETYNEGILEEEQAPHFFRICCRVTLLLSVFTFAAITIAFGSKANFTQAPEQMHVDSNIDNVTVGGGPFFAVILTMVIIKSIKYRRNKRRQRTDSCAALLSSAEEAPQSELITLEDPTPHGSQEILHFDKSGILIQFNDANCFSSDSRGIQLEICWDENSMPLQSGEVQLSPVIKSQPYGKQLSKPVQVRIPHSALVYLSNGWDIKPKSSVPHKGSIVWKGENKFQVHNNEVSFQVDNLTSYVIIGTSLDNGKPTKKRFQCAVFGGVGTVGVDYTAYLYNLDDSESSFEKIMQEEKSTGRTLLGSPQSFYVETMIDTKVKISVKEPMEGWIVREIKPEFITQTSLKDSYQAIPRTTVKFKHDNGRNRDFLCEFELTAEDTTTSICAVATIREDPSRKFQEHQPGFGNGSHQFVTGRNLCGYTFYSRGFHAQETVHCGRICAYSTNKEDSAL